MIRPWKTLARQSLKKSPLFEIVMVERESTDGVKGTFFVVEMPDWVNVVARTPDGKFVLIRQYRQGTDSITVEIAGGVVDTGESFLEAARRELREETGYEASQWIEIGSVEPNPAIQNNRCVTFLALDARQTASTEFDEHEDIEVTLAAEDEVRDLIGSGAITHALVVAAFHHYWTSASIRDNG